MAATIHSFEDDADSVLETMGLKRELLAEVCRRGLAEFKSTTLDHPSNAPGTFLYFELVRSLRELLRPFGWEACEDGLSLVLQEEFGWAIAVSSANVNVGDLERNPSFRYPRGAVSQAAIGGNARQLGLFDSVPSLLQFAALPSRRRVDFDQFQTWWLLHYVDAYRRVMRAELSFPVTVNELGETDQWRRRIILDSIPFDEEPQVESSGGGDQWGPEFDVPVRKKE